MGEARRRHQHEGDIEHQSKTLSGAEIRIYSMRNLIKRLSPTKPPPPDLQFDLALILGQLAGLKRGESSACITCNMVFGLDGVMPARTAIVRSPLAEMNARRPPMVGGVCRACCERPGAWGHIQRCIAEQLLGDELPVGPIGPGGRA